MNRTVMIKKKYEFKRILTKGKKYRGNLFDVFVKKNNQEFNMLGIAISRKAGKSVKRNKIKRLVKENYKIIESDLKSGFNILVLWKKKADFEDFDFYKIKKEFKEVLGKARLL